MNFKIKFKNIFYFITNYKTILIVNITFYVTIKGLFAKIK